VPVRKCPRCKEPTTERRRRTPVRRGAREEGDAADGVFPDGHQLEKHRRLRVAGPKVGDSTGRWTHSRDGEKSCKPEGLRAGSAQQLGAVNGAESCNAPKRLRTTGPFQGQLANAQVQRRTNRDAPVTWASALKGRPTEVAQCGALGRARDRPNQRRGTARDRPNPHQGTNSRIRAVDKTTAIGYAG